jgi:hypothetical protein
MRDRIFLSIGLTAWFAALAFSAYATEPSAGVGVALVRAGIMGAIVLPLLLMAGLAKT